MKYSIIAIALAAMVAGCSSSATRDSLQIQNPTVLQNGFSAGQDRASGAVTPQWIGTYSSIDAGPVMRDVQKRLNALGARKENYFGYKAQCWLNAALDERRQHDGWGFVEEALHEASRMTTALETGNGLTVDNPDLRTSAVVRPDLWRLVLGAKASPDFASCVEAQRLTACSEVELIHAGHEAWTRNFHESQRIADGVAKGAPDIAGVLKSCTPPPPAPVARIPEKMTLQADATFSFDRSDLAGMSPAGKAKLDQLVKDLKLAGDVTGINIVGYTDRLGSDAYNRTLSTKRARTVQQYLQAGGVTVPMTAHGLGKDDPVADCHDHDHQALIACLAPNRRVELDFMRSSNGIRPATQVVPGSPD